MQEELISIIVPVYNIKDYVEICIKSIINQTYKNIEIIVINDGSTDGSGEICEQLKKKDQRVKVIHTENSGVSHARNIGIDESSSEWIVFIDGDDYVEIDYIETMYKKICEIENLDIVMVGYYADDGAKNQPYQFFKSSQPVLDKRKADLLKMCLCIDVEDVNGKTNIGVPWGKMYRKSLIVDNQIRFPVELKKMQDAIFNIKVYDKAKRIYYLDEPLYHYRVWSGSVCHKYFPNYSKFVELLIKEFEKALENMKYLKDYEDVLNAKKVMLFMEIIRLEYILDENYRSERQKIKGISILSKKDLYKNSFKINNKYLSSKQKVVCLLIKGKFFYLLYKLLKYKYGN